MNIFGVGLPEVTVILVLALIIFGPKKLPELGKQLGKTLKSLKIASNEFQNEIEKGRLQAIRTSEKLQAEAQRNLLHDVIPEMQQGNIKKAGYEVSLFPWIPLSAEETIPIPSDWVVTMVEPAFKLKEMYNENIVNYGKDNQGTTTDEQSDSDNSD
mgnify:CR=1 FL=1